MTSEIVFFLDPKRLKKNTFRLSDSESFHAAKVMRLESGQRIILINGKGTGYYARITQIGQNFILGEITEKIEMLGENKFTINIAPSLIKRIRFESLLEKATEMGVKKIQPLITRHSLKKTINMKRCKKIIISAAKQCKRSYFPILYEPISIIPWLDELDGQYIAGLQNLNTHLSNLRLKKKDPIHIIIGPEGDFDSSEVKAMEKAGVTFFTLGNRRLKSETAMFATLSILNEMLY